jgi:hypothetical protein
MLRSNPQSPGWQFFCLNTWYAFVFTLLTPCTLLILPWQLYAGFTTRSDAGFDAEVAAWVTARRAQQYAPAVTQLDGVLFKNRQDLEDVGFKVCCFLLCALCLLRS